MVDSLKNVKRGGQANRGIAEVSAQVSMGSLFKGADTIDYALAWVTDIEGLGASALLVGRLVEQHDLRRYGNKPVGDLGLRF